MLRPDEVVEPYERTLNNMPKQQRLAWAELVQQRLLELLPTGIEVILLAGSRYREGIEAFLRRRGFTVTVPLAGLKFGQQLHRLQEMAG